MARRRFCWIQGGIPKYEFAIIYYKDAGDSKTVWLRDGEAAPVQIATWPKRVPLFEQQTWVQDGGSIQGYVGYLGGESQCLDDSRATTGGDTFSLNPYKNTVDVQVSLLSGTSSIQTNFAGKTSLIAGFGGGGFFNFSGLQSLASNSSINTRAAVISVFATSSSTPGSTWSGAFESISNNYGVIGLTKTPIKTLFSLVDHPAVSSSEIPQLDRHGRVIYGQPGEILTASYPDPPSYDPDFNDGSFIQPASLAYRGRAGIWNNNGGTAVEQPTNTSFSNLIGTEFGTASVYNFATDVFTENIPVPGIESEAEKIIAIVALAV